MSNKLHVPVFPCIMATEILLPASVEIGDGILHVKIKSQVVYPDLFGFFFICIDEDILKLVYPASVLIWL